MKYLLYILFFLLIPAQMIAQDTITVPVDIVYRAETKNYYVSNSFEGNGNILKLDSTGKVIETFFSDLHYPGGLCLVGDVLYVGDNYGKWNDSLPSHLVGIDLNTGTEVMNFLVASYGAYIDLMTTDSSGYLYIGNSGTGDNDGKVHKFNIQTQSLTDLVTQTTRPYGVSYDHVNNRIIFVESGPLISFLKSVSPEGGEVTKVFYMNRRIEGVIMAPDGDFYISSWGSDSIFGNDTVYKAGNSLAWKMEISTGHNRPFGMCIGKDNFLAVCNWGEHSLSFIDLSLYGIEETLTKNNDFTIYPNPSNGIVNLKFNNSEIQEVEVIIHDIIGQLVYQEKIGRMDVLSEKQIDLQQLPKGTYIVNIYNGSVVSHEKLILY